MSVPVRFANKKECNFTNRSEHFFSIIRFTQKLPCKSRISVVNKTLQRNAFYDYPKNILIAMIHNSEMNNSEMSVKKLKWRRIFNSKMALFHSARQRILKIRKLLFNDLRYFEMIDRQDIPVTESPVWLCGITQ